MRFTIYDTPALMGKPKHERADSITMDAICTRPHPRAQGKGSPTMAETASNRIVINVLGKNRAGIVAAVSRILGEANVDIRDITQSIIEDIFTMTMIADASQSSLDFSQLQESLTACGSEVGVEITLQREDVFNFMYRL